VAASGRAAGEPVRAFSRLRRIRTCSDSRLTEQWLCGSEAATLTSTMQRRIQRLVLVATALCAAAAGRAADHYVSPNGSASGDGSLANPWKLQKALDQPSAVDPGDTIWLRGGVYTGHYVSHLSGSSSAPIVVRQYPGESAKIDGNYGGNLPTLEIHGVYTWYWGFDIYNSDTGRWSSDGDDPPKRGEGIQVIGDHIKLIHLVIHDTSQGILTSTAANDTEIYGCVIYYNGFDASDRGHGHGIYSANDPGNATKKIRDNIIFEQFGYGLHGYTEGGNLHNIEYKGNTVFDNGGISSHGWTTNILLGGLRRAVNPKLIDNATYNQAHAGSNNLGYSAGCTSPTVTGNYLDGDTALKVVSCNSVTMTGNSFYDTVTGFTPSQFPNNTYYSSRPGGAKVFVRPSAYEAGRANITIYNWDLASEVDVDVSGVMQPGASYVLLNAQSPFGTPVATGTYAGGALSVPMDAFTPAKPVGLPRPASTGPEFNTFILLSTQPGEFFDVPESNPFHDAVFTVATDGVSVGCGGGNYCPDASVKRSQMAVFLLKAEHGAAYVPPPATGSVFSDVSASAFAAAWIERLKAEGITGGCGNGKYCSNKAVKRSQMAVFLLKASLGASYSPPAAKGTVFSDVPKSAFAAAWIEDLHARGMTSGCGGGKYCPSSVSTRGQMAAFLVTAFSLP
jgi:hypothetical protein